ncbi:uncharacterized protein RCC_02408 [Ramularia collo-cygni]|uniref:Uncharacterized protein n=1 Tax=Ramularia collo-cygni TaxID=112498 RepID=A0A2D3V271_9PEZI|nr:uncharacterized protein RCC_02408 [Ramularia collo-cygni]CZT16574.1 uncharacterized protein RCC_02408 [Ramularia collo-cygni]
MDAFRLYTLGTSAYLAAQSLPLLLTPKLIVSLLATEVRGITDLETYLCRTLALVLLTLSASIVLLSGHIPLGNQATAPITKAQEEDGAANPYASPILVITTAYHTLTAFYLYTQITWGFSFGFGSGLVLSALLACFGGWVSMFGMDKGRISKSTGADKRTSGILFPSESASGKKKEKEKEGKRKSLSSKFR